MMKKALPISELLSALCEDLTPEEILASAMQVHFASQITKYRVMHGMSQAEFADFMGVTQGTISKWENGDFNFTIEKMAYIACKLDLKIISMEAAHGVVSDETSSHIPYDVSASVENYSNQGNITYLSQTPEYRWCGNRPVSYPYDELKEE